MGATLKNCIVKGYHPVIDLKYFVVLSHGSALSLNDIIKLNAEYLNKPRSFGWGMEEIRDIEYMFPMEFLI